jgi:predicted acylesterase/phospholipase RssA
MKHLGISGGGTKIGGLFGAAEVLIKERNYRPDIISGISAGALLSVPLAMEKFDLVKELVLNFTMKDFFSDPPVMKNGKLSWRAIVNILAGNPYMGRQDNLPKTLARVISKSEFNTYQKGDFPVCWVGAVDFRSGGRKYYNLKEVDYKQFLTVVNASSSLPLFTNGVVNDGHYLYDGGVRDHIGTPWILERYDTIIETVSIYSRPRDY